MSQTNQCGVQVALRALSCMEHRGACSGGMDSTTASWMTQMNPARLPLGRISISMVRVFPGWPALSWGVEPLCEEGTLKSPKKKLWTYVERYTYTYICICYIYIIYIICIYLYTCNFNAMDHDEEDAGSFLCKW